MKKREDIEVFDRIDELEKQLKETKISMLLAVEYGYVMCEAGRSLEYAIKQYKKEKNR